MAYQPQDRYQQIEQDSQNFWAGYIGSLHPPAPSYRMVNGKQRLGRYMNPYDCQGLIEEAQNRWTKWYTGFFISIAVGVAFSAVDWVLIFVALPILSIWYFAVKAKHRSQYDKYWKIQERIISTGQPEWVPYTKDRLKLIDRNPMALWP